MTQEMLVLMHFPPTSPLLPSCFPKKSEKEVRAVHGNLCLVKNLREKNGKCEPEMSFSVGSEAAGSPLGLCLLKTFPRFQTAVSGWGGKVFSHPLQMLLSWH